MRVATPPTASRRGWCAGPLRHLGDALDEVRRSEYLHRDIFEMAPAYAFHLEESQAFVDGNKRTGLAAAYMFLTLNGRRLVEGPRDSLRSQRMNEVVTTARPARLRASRGRA